MTKSEAYKKELEKLETIFKDVEPAKRQLVEGLIEDAAFLKAENFALRQSLEQTGMIKVHPSHPDIQKPIEAARQYLKNVNSYAVVIKTLNGVLNKSMTDPDEDELEEFE
jgi:regulator of replication initiation timing